ncbi:MAG: RnfABCDGE type electron transport complex subunit D [Cellvibrionales bacterium]|nr:RnfABCDGE type electron transport complex subunit D [Cellvibrionales bacterium]
MLKRISSPHAHGSLDTAGLMRTLCLAALPGLAAITWFYGWGTLINLAWAIALALIMEAAIMRLRGRPLSPYIGDYSAVVTAGLLALSLPPYTPWWATLVGIAFAIPIAKHLYGGLGYNPFNPAMVGYVVLLISFPVPMVEWASPRGLAEQIPGPLTALEIIFLGTAPPDGVTGATALDILKQNTSLTLAQLYTSEPLFAAGRIAAAGSEWVNLAFLAGGLWLLWRRVYSWHAPVGMLASLLVLSTLFYDNGSSASLGSPLFHLFTGATMLGAFFIITDPVSGCTSNLGRLLFGIGAGTLTFVIRAWGNYPDAVAFGVLLMNFAAPLLDYYSLPRTYGHAKRRQVRIRKNQ